jgi:hypothetical protein
MNLKHLLFLICTILFVQSELIAQTTVTIPTANTGVTITGNAATTIRRKPLGSNRSYERTAIKYTQAEVGSLGNISGLAFYCDTVLNPGRTPVKIYIKEVTDTTFTASTVAAEEAGATLVFADTLNSTLFVKNTWVPITFSTPFLHATLSNIEIIIETNAGGTAGSDLTALAKGFRFSTKGLVNSTQYWQSATGSSTPPTTNGTLTNFRPNIQLTITTAPACTTPPNAGTALSSAISTCVGTNFSLSLSGSSTGLGLTYQWLSSTNNTSWDTIVGATSVAYQTNQAVAKYYACIIQCNGQKDTSTSVNVTMNPFYDCYCITSLGGGCTGGQGTAIDSVSFTNTTLAKGSTGCATGSYIAYPASGNTTASLTQGETYTLSNKFTGAVKSSVWIDYNRNGIFENSEWKQLSLTSATGTVINNNISVPANAQAGITGMRIRTRTSNSTNDSTSACTNFGNTGETEDYLITIVAASPCIAPPNPGVLSVTDTLTCANSPVTFSITGNTIGTGQTYTWYSSTDNTNWTAITAANDKVYSAALSANGFYKCVITCSTLSATTNVVQVNVKAFSDCYCVSGIGGNCTTQATALDSLAIEGTTLDNGNTGCGTAAYNSFPNSGSTTGTLMQGQGYILKAKFSGSVRASVWIDYNHNGKFDNSEWQLICTSSIANVALSANLNIPLTALTGETGMRIRTRATNGVIDSTVACAAFGSGETEDYKINIIQATACIAPPNAGNVVASKMAVCPGGIVNLAIKGNTIGLGQTYQWIKSADGKNWTNMASQSLSTKDTVNTATYYACVLTCSNLNDTTAAQLVKTNPFYNCYCTATLGGGCVTSLTSIDSVNITKTTMHFGFTGCSLNNYASYPDSGNSTANLYKNFTYELLTKFAGVSRAGLWIDFDHSGSFDDAEFISITDTSILDSVTQSFISIPANAQMGKTGMRIRTRAIAGTLTATDACSQFGSGETEDYVITIDTFVVQGLQNILTDNFIKIYPNPAANKINIVQLKNKSGKINIYDLNGRLLITEKLSDGLNTITTEQLSSGIYFYHYIDANNNGLSNGKIAIVK